MPAMISAVADSVSFFLEWARAPHVIGSIGPSGLPLARKMAAEITAGLGPVVELGPGTGSVTEQILKRGVDEADLVLVELNRRFARKLAHRYPRATVLNTAAETLDGDDFDAGCRPGFVISSLPLLCMPEGQVAEIVEAAFALMHADGVMVQYTYGPSCPVRPEVLERLGLRAIGGALTHFNVPPARVYRIVRSGAA